MTTYFVDDDATGNDDGTSWSNAWTALADSVATTVGGDIVKIEATHDEINTGSHLVLNLEAANPGVTYCRVDSTSSDAYDTTGTTYNFQTTTGTYDISVNRAGVFCGLRFSANARITIAPDTDSSQQYRDCHFRCGIAYYVQISYAARLIDCTFLTSDVSDSSTEVVRFSSTGSPAQIINPVFSTGTAYRNVVFFGAYNAPGIVVGADLSIFTRNPTSLLHVSSGGGVLRLIDCKLPPNYQVFSAVNDGIKRVELIRCNGTDDIEIHTECGSMVSEATIVRTGGANNSLDCTTNSFCAATNPIFTQWIYAIADAAESKTFDIHFAYSGTRLTDEEIFMELEFMVSGTAPYGDFATTQKKAILGDTVGNPITASETWGGSETYEEYLRITKTVGVAGSIVRARIGIEKTSQTDSIYIDPYLVVS